MIAGCLISIGKCNGVISIHDNDTRFKKKKKRLAWLEGCFQKNNH
jgi:hypothetical protein